MNDVLPDGSQLNVVSLRDYMDMRMDALCKEMDERFASTREAVRVGSAVIDIRLASMNEFRDAMKDQTSKFIARDEYKGLLERVNKLEQSDARAEGKASQSSVNLAYLFSAGGLLIAIVSLLLRFLSG